MAADLFGLQHLVATSLWGNAAFQVPFLALQKQEIDLLVFHRVLQQEALHRYKKFLQGYIRYKQIRDYPKRRQAPVVKKIGCVSLRDYGAFYNVSSQAKPVLVIPSLINQSYIFDLCPGFSLFEHMVQNHLHPFLVDWGQGGEGDGFEKLLDAIIFPFSETVRALTGRSQMALLGYCMGGLLSLAAVQGTDYFDRIALLATPWDFHAGNPPTHRELLLKMVQEELELSNHLSAFCLQLIFHFIDPTAAIRKFSSFVDIAIGTPTYHRFLALEQWVNDAVPLSREFTEEIFGRWYQENPFAMSKKILGRPLDPTIPTLMILAEQDRIVPLQCASALSQVLPQAISLSVPLGHVGLLVSGRAKDLVWKPLVNWLK